MFQAAAHARYLIGRAAGRIKHQRAIFIWQAACNHMAGIVGVPDIKLSGNKNSARLARDHNAVIEYSRRPVFNHAIQPEELFGGIWR